MLNTYSNEDYYSKLSSSDIPADLNSLQAVHFKNTLPKFSEEAIYIYSFKEKRMIYADGLNIKTYKALFFNGLSVLVQETTLIL